MKPSMLTDIADKFNQIFDKVEGCDDGSVCAASSCSNIRACAFNVDSRPDFRGEFEPYWIPSVRAEHLMENVDMRNSLSRKYLQRVINDYEVYRFIRYISYYYDCDVHVYYPICDNVVKVIIDYRGFAQAYFTIVIVC